MAEPHEEYKEKHRDGYGYVSAAGAAAGADRASAASLRPRVVAGHNDSMQGGLALPKDVDASAPELKDAWRKARGGWMGDAARG
jgi:hypothetical protein